MPEFVVIVESRADARTATKLAERVLAEQVDWLDGVLEHLFQWSGLEVGTEHSCWTNIGDIVERFSNDFNFPRIRSNGKLKTDGKAARKIMTLISFLQHKQSRNIRAVIFVRDLDNQPERREHIAEARSEYTNQQAGLEIVNGTANRMREAWVLNGFIPSNSEETRILEEIRGRLSFDPCEEAHKLRSNSWEDPDRVRNPKVVLENLTRGNGLREQQCWEETSLEQLRERGRQTGLTDYLHEIKQRLIPVITE